MRRTEIDRLNEPYKTEGGAGDRFPSAIGADIPHARNLTKEILSELNQTTFGLPTLASLPDQERILVSDYLYQCATSIEDNLVEAKLHLLEWQDTADKLNKWMADVISLESGEPEAKLPIVTKPTDDMPHVLEKLHICAFFRAIGSTIDCLSGCIVGIVGLSRSLRHSDIGSAQTLLGQLKDDGTPGLQVQISYRNFLDDSITAHGPTDWLTWATQYRNMFVHRGRRLFVGHFSPTDTLLFDGKGKPIPRAKLVGHLAKYPDKSDVEALLLGGPTVLNEGTEVTLEGIFKSTRDFLEINCEELLKIWQQRKQDPSLIIQPAMQWERPSKPCVFAGYDPNAEKLSIDVLITNPIAGRRFRAASAMDDQRKLWAGSKWLT